MSDIVERLRASVTQCRAVDRSALLAEAAAEIERLRCNQAGGDSGSVALTDAEREAVEATIVDLDGGANFNEQRFWPMLAKRLRERSAILRGLLERLE